jgi:multiple sugar transport system substrate-binding protein
MNPGVKVEVISIPFPVMKQKLVVSARSADAPDLAYIDGRWVPEMAAAGMLAEIGADVKTLQRADWYDAPWAASEIGGKTYAVPDRIDPWMVYYNTDMFAKAGVVSFPKTLDELAVAAQKISTGGVYGWGLLGAKDNSLISRFLNFVYACHGNLLKPDGKHSAFAEPEAVQALQFYGDLLNKYHGAQPSALANGINDVNQLFQTQQVAMIIDGPWLQGTLRQMVPNLKWAVAQMPPAIGKSPRFLSSSWYYTMFQIGRNKAETFKLIEFATRPENMAKSVVTLPARKSAAKDERFAGPDFAPWIGAVPNAVPFPITDRFSEIADIVGDAV